MKSPLKANDLVRIVQSGGSLGPTLWIVESIGKRGSCVIREADKPNNRSQQFDTSLLQKVDRVAEIKAGNIKQGPLLLSKVLSF